MTWHKRLAQAREAKEINKSAFAKLVNVSAPTVTDWESGKIKMIDGVNLLKVCDVLGISPKWLMHGKPDTNATDVAPVMNLEHQFEPPQALMQWIYGEEGEILSCYRATDKEGKLRIMRTARSARKVLLLDLVVDKSKI